MSQSAGGGAAMQRYGLPKTIHGPAVGQPGDPVSKGDFQGNTRRAVTTSGQQQTIGLPACRSSAYVDGYGDHIRSDMHRRIDGTDARQPRVMLRPVQQQQQRPQQQTAVYRYGDALQPAYKRGNSY